MKRILVLVVVIAIVWYIAAARVGGSENLLDLLSMRDIIEDVGATRLAVFAGLALFGWLVLDILLRTRRDLIEREKQRKK